MSGSVRLAAWRVPVEVLIGAGIGSTFYLMIEQPAGLTLGQTVALGLAVGAGGALIAAAVLGLVREARESRKAWPGESVRFRDAVRAVWRSVRSSSSEDLGPIVERAWWPDGDEGTSLERMAATQTLKAVCANATKQHTALGENRSKACDILRTWAGRRKVWLGIPRIGFVRSLRDALSWPTDPTDLHIPPHLSTVKLLWYLEVVEAAKHNPSPDYDFLAQIRDALIWGRNKDKLISEPTPGP